MAGRRFRRTLRPRHDGRVQPDPAPATIPRVILVDADDRVRESLCGLLCIGHRLQVVGSTGQTADALDLAAAQHPDIVIIDPRLPQNDGGMAFIQQLRDTVPGVRIVAMSGATPSIETIRFRL